MVNYNQQVGSHFNDILTVPDRTVVYGLGGGDILSTSTGISVLVGGLGADSYIVNNNTTAIILDDGNSAGDVVVATGIGFFSSNTVMLEIDSRHFVAYDTNSGQALIIIDWQNASNIIESVQLSDGTFPYEFIASNFRSTPGYAGTYTLEQADAQFLGGKLAANGLTSSETYNLINIVKLTNAWFGGAGYRALFGLGSNKHLNEVSNYQPEARNGNNTHVVNNTSSAVSTVRPDNDALVGGFSRTQSLAMVEPIALPPMLQINMLTPLPILLLLILWRSLLLVLKLG